LGSVAWHWETGRANIDVLRATGLPYKLEHTDHLEQQLERHPPDQATMTPHLTDDQSLRLLVSLPARAGVCPLIASVSPCVACLRVLCCLCSTAVPSWSCATRPACL
jgi:hypothetical protein